MKNIIKIFTVLAFSFCMSCSDILDTHPESTITVNSFWQSEEDALGGLYGMYNQFRVFADANIVLLGEARSEIMGHGLANADYRIKYFENTLTETNADLDWQQMYRIVNFSNLILNYVPGIDFVDTAEQDKILAQAYAMRAYIYFVMAKTWGDLPVFTEPVEGYDAETTFRERKPVSEIFTLIKSDIDQSNNLFADYSFNANRSIWNKAALNMLKAEVYLWTGKTMGGGESDISTALSALNDAENADVELLDDFGSIFDYGNKGNKEVILAMNFQDLEASNNYFGDMYVGSGSITTSLTQETRDKIGTPGGNNWWAPTAYFRDQFSDDDQRKDASFFELYTYENDVPSYLTTIVWKGKGFEDAGERKFLDDIIIYRYADLLLMKAEAKNALGQDPSAEMNQVRQRAYGDQFPNYSFVSGSQVENDAAILQERLFELAFESKRWWDLVRFDKAYELVPSLQGRESESQVLWPIPISTLSLNSKLVQNPGY